MLRNQVRFPGQPRAFAGEGAQRSEVGGGRGGVRSLFTASIAEYAGRPKAYRRSAMTVIGVIAQGMMGAGVGRRLHESSAEVRTLLAGRSQASAERAKKAGMSPTADERELLSGADFFLSIPTRSARRPRFVSARSSRRAAPILSMPGSLAARRAPATVPRSMPRVQ